MRYAVALISVLVGIALAVWQFVAAALPNPVPQGLAELTIFEACITFYSGVYCTGRVFYLALGRKNEANTVRQGQRWHMLLLHCFGLFFVIALGARKNWLQLLLQPVVLAMALAVLMSAIDFLFGARVAATPCHRQEDEINSNE